ncbi:MAG TPA: 23S rRNA (adenine(2503)-C(2))-methyltransferase RlmN, partial [Bacteroidota bacterium]
LREFVESVGEKPYRSQQLYGWMYAKCARSFDEMTDLPREFRSLLKERATLGNLEAVTRQTSQLDGTTKLLFRLEDGLMIESVLIPAERESATEAARLTLCVSTQVGCPLDCKFCATGTMGFSRNLTVGEIADQVLFFQASTESRISNVVFMGMGEPMLNYENLMKAIDILSSDHGLNIGRKHITVSTAGYADHIRRMADEDRKVRLALSLHSLDNEKRLLLMPINKKYPLPVLLDSVEYYYRKTRQRPTFEYILFEGLNDTREDLQKLVSLSKRIPSKINLIPFHSIDVTRPTSIASTLRPASDQRMEEFAKNLRAANVTVMIRSSAGEDIDAACGQLAVSEENITT